MNGQRALTAFLVLAVMTVWIRESWAASILQAAVLLGTACVLVRDAARRRDWRPAPVAAIPAGMAVWGCGQLAAGVTVAPSSTWDAVCYWAAAACLLFLGRRVCATPAAGRRFLRQLVAAGGAICLAGMVQAFSSQGLVLWMFPSGYDSHVIGPFTSPNNYAAFVELLLPIALFTGLRSHRPFPWLVTAAGLFASVVASGSRAGALLTALEAVMVFWLSKPRSGGHPGVRRRLLGFALLSAIFSLVVGYQFLWQRLAGPHDPMALRREFLQSSVAMTRAEPVHGFGLGTWTFVYPQYALVDPGVDANHAHNEWAQWAAEGGIPALCLVLALFAWTVRHAVRPVWGVGLVSVFVHSLVDYPFLRFGLAAWIFVLIGVLAASRPAAGRQANWPAWTAAAAVLPVLAAALLAGRSGWADVLFRQDTVEAAQKAVRWRPDRADYHAALADLDRGHAIEHLRAAVAANPYMTRTRIALADRLEAAGDYAGAAGSLLEAARRDHLFAPAWTLANFYFRRQDADRFWEWARRAALLSPDDITPLLDLCFALEDDPAAVRDRIAASPALARQLFTYLISRRSPRELAAEAVARAGAATAADRPGLLEYADRSMASGDVRTAAEVWRLLSARGLVAGRTSLLFNGEFQEPVTGRGFDWRVHPAEGVLADRQLAETGVVLAVRFSGKQPENCDVLSQAVSLRPESRYLLEFEYRTQDLPDETGLSWSLAGSAPVWLKASDGWTMERKELQAADAVDRLVLRYARVPGTTRAEGTLVLRRVRLIEAPSTLSAASGPPVSSAP